MAIYAVSPGPAFSPVLITYHHGLIPCTLPIKFFVNLEILQSLTSLWVS